jgi:hypothetical protein
MLSLPLFGLCLWSVSGLLLVGHPAPHGSGGGEDRDRRARGLRRQSNGRLSRPEAAGGGFPARGIGDCSAPAQDVRRRAGLTRCHPPRRFRNRGATLADRLSLPLDATGYRGMPRQRPPRDEGRAARCRITVAADRRASHRRAAAIGVSDPARLDPLAGAWVQLLMSPGRRCAGHTRNSVPMPSG